MFGRKKSPVLTTTFCNELEKVRTAIEVLTGKRVQLQQLDLNTGKGKVGLGDKESRWFEEFEVTFFLSRNDLLEFKLDGILNPVVGWNIACFEESGKALVINQDNPRMHNNVLKMRWVGYSAMDRWEEPLFIRDVEKDATQRGLTLHEHLCRMNIPPRPPRYFYELKAGDTFVAGSIRWIAVASVHGGKFAVPLEGTERGQIVHLSEYADIRQIA
jgi:hypothetical protein